MDGVTPLSEACARGHVTLVSLLLQRGAKPSGSRHSDSPIHRAAAKGQRSHSTDTDSIICAGPGQEAACDASGKPGSVVYNGVKAGFFIFASWDSHMSAEVLRPCCSDPAQVTQSAWNLWFGMAQTWIRLSTSGAPLCTSPAPISTWAPSRSCWNSVRTCRVLV